MDDLTKILKAIEYLMEKERMDYCEDCKKWYDPVKEEERRFYRYYMREERRRRARRPGYRNCCFKKELPKSFNH